MSRRKSFKIVTATPVIIPAAYSSGDFIGSLTRIPDAVLDSSGVCLLQSLVVVDKALQSVALDLWFFDNAVTIASADNAAFDLTDAELAAYGIGSITLAAGDYKASSSNSMATLRALNLVLQSKVGVSNNKLLPAGASPRDLYFALVSRATPTYASASDLVFKFGFEQF